MTTKLGARKWAALLLVGLFGQFAWTIENMYFNVFLYNTISTDPGYIAAMVGWSAAAATLTTLVMGALSDRLGKRKAFICGGYLLWGLSTAAFGLITPENAARLFPGANAAAAAATLVVILDCVMTFFGSTANDAAFNAYVTDVTESGNRGRAESVLAILPLISMLIIFGAFDGLTQQGRWREFFGIFGLAVSAVGLISLFLVKDAAGLKPRAGLRFQEPALRPAPRGRAGKPGAVPVLCRLLPVLRGGAGVLPLSDHLHPELPGHHRLRHRAGRGADPRLRGERRLRPLHRPRGQNALCLPRGGGDAAGPGGHVFRPHQHGVMVAGTVMMSGYMMLTAALSANIRDWTPEDQAGHFQGIRMIFAVLLPMVIGPAIGAAVIRGSDSTYVDLGQVKTVPTPGIFLAAALVLLLTACRSSF